MARRRSAVKREPLPDPIFGSVHVNKFINCLMRNGKKSIAEKMVYKAIKNVEGKVEDAKGVEIFQKALENIAPRIEVKSRRVGGSTYQVPIEVRDDRQLTLAMRWLIIFAKARREKSMAENLAAEILDAYNERGGAVKKKEDTHRMADANRAFAHYRV